MSRSTQLPNVLAARYASPELVAIWSPEHKVVLERRLWLAVLRAQPDLGVDVPDGVIEAYEAVVDKVDLASIEARERVTRHDVKARIEEFSALAGHEHIHKGMTSRDLTENVEQLQVRASLALVRDRMVAALARLGRLAAEHAGARDGRPQPQRGRPGHDARQAVRQRRRGAAPGPRAASRSCSPATRSAGSRARWARTGPARPARRRPAKLDALEAAVARHLGFERGARPASARCTRASSTSTSSPRSCRPRPGPSSLATTIRLMAGHELATEGFQPGQVGSSAMPHKMNTRSCERINGLAVVLRGHLTMVAELAGDQWNEGDVSLLGRAAGRPARRLPRRRRPLPDLPHRARRVRAVPGRHRRASSSATCRSSPPPRCSWPRCSAGVGREEAHEAIKEHAVAVALAMREAGGRGGDDLLDRLAADARLRARRATSSTPLLAEPLVVRRRGRRQVEPVRRAGRQGRRRHPRPPPTPRADPVRPPSPLD